MQITLPLWASCWFLYRRKRFDNLHILDHSIKDFCFKVCQPNQHFTELLRVKLVKGTECFVLRAMSVGTTSRKSIWSVVWHLHNQPEFPSDVSHSSKAIHLFKLSTFPPFWRSLFGHIDQQLHWSKWWCSCPLFDLCWLVAWSLMGKWSSIHRVACGQFL